MDEPDGSLPAVADTINQLIVTRGICQVVSLGAHGYTGHADHIATHQAASLAVAHSRLQGRELRHLALTASGSGQHRITVSPATTRRKLSAMACHRSQYPVAAFTPVHSRAVICGGYAIEASFWSSFACRQLVTVGETYEEL